MRYGYFNSDAQGPNEPTTAQPPLILPVPEEQQSYSQLQQWSPSGKPIRPEDMVRRPQSSLPTNPLTRTRHLWKNDPAYRVLFIAIGIVLLSSIVCVGLVSAMFNQNNTQNAPGGGKGPQQIANTGGVSTSIPTPTATPIPTATPTPTPIMPTPTPVPTQPPANGPLTVQIVNIPNTVQNGQTVSVSIKTSKPGASVHLSITYTNANQISMNNESQTADDGGFATIQWRVQVVPTRIGKTATAQVKAIAQDQQGHQATSQTVTVQINTGL
jgi:hypothetical protein